MTLSARASTFGGIVSLIWRIQNRTPPGFPNEVASPGAGRSRAGTCSLRFWSSGEVCPQRPCNGPVLARFHLGRCTVVLALRLNCIHRPNPTNSIRCADQFNSAQSKCGLCWYIEYTRSAILDIRAAALIDNPLVSAVNFALIIARYPIYAICSLNS